MTMLSQFDRVSMAIEFSNHPLATCDTFSYTILKIPRKKCSCLNSKDKLHDRDFQRAEWAVILLLCLYARGYNPNKVSRNQHFFTIVSALQPEKYIVILLTCVVNNVIKLILSEKTLNLYTRWAWPSSYTFHHPEKIIMTTPSDSFFPIFVTIFFL